MNKLLGISLIIFLFGCGTEEEVPEVPKGLLERSEFISVMVDLQILEAHFHRMYIRPDLYAVSLDSSSLIIFEQHETTKEQFELTLDYYSSQPDSMYSIYETTLDSVNQRISNASVLKM